ncbi:MAG: hypothetical protein HRU19_19080 [Pseudobacteriovorax sp.]|nr:hypothetical protein [Pseudobacteriovorax sp.]
MFCSQVRYRHAIVLFFLPWLFSGCKNGVSDSFDAKQRLCQSTSNTAKVIYALQGERPTALALFDDAKSFIEGLEVKRLSGPELSLTEGGCIETGDTANAGTYLILSRSQNLYAIYGLDDLSEDLILRTWNPEYVSDRCQSSFFTSGPFGLPIDFDSSVDLRALSFSATATRLGSEERLDLFSKELGNELTNTSWTFQQDGSYELAFQIIDPFGVSLLLPNTCQVDVTKNRPSIELDTTSDIVQLTTGESVFFKMSPFASLQYCFDRVESRSCQEFFGSEGSSITFSEGGRYLLRARGIDPEGRVGQILEKRIVVQEETPKLRIKWSNEKMNQLGYTVREPKINFTSELKFHNDPLLANDLGEALLCKLSYRISATETIGASFAYCDNEECKGRSLEKFVPCTSPFSFYLQPESTFSPNSVDWPSLDFGALQLTVRAQDDLQNFSETSLLLNYQIRNFRSWQQETLEDASINSATFKDTAIVLTTNTELYSFDKNGYQLESIPEGINRLGRVFYQGSHLFLDSDVGLFQKPSDGTDWQLVTLPNARDPYRIEDIKAIYFDQPSQRHYFLYRAEGQSELKVSYRSESGEFADGPCSFAGLQTPEQRSLSQFSEITRVSEGLMFLADEGYVIAEENNCRVDYFPLHRNRSLFNRDHSFSIDQLTGDVTAIRPGFVMKWQNGQWRSYSLREEIPSVDLPRISQVLRDSLNQTVYVTGDSELFIVDKTDNGSMKSIAQFNSTTRRLSEEGFNQTVGAFTVEGVDYLVTSRGIFFQNSSDSFYQSGWSHLLSDIDVKILRTLDENTIVATGSVGYHRLSTGALVEPSNLFDLGSLSVSAFDSSRNSSRFLVGNDISSTSEFTFQRIIEVENDGTHKQRPEESSLLPKARIAGNDLFLSDISGGFFTGIYLEPLNYVDRDSISVIVDEEGSPVTALRAWDNVSADVFIIDNQGDLRKWIRRSNQMIAPMDQPDVRFIEGLAIDRDLLLLSQDDDEQTFWRFNGLTFETANAPWDLSVNQVYQMFYDDKKDVCVVGEWQSVACFRENDWEVWQTPLWNDVFTDAMPPRWDRDRSRLPEFTVHGDYLFLAPNNVRGPNRTINLFSLELMSRSL